MRHAECANTCISHTRGDQDIHADERAYVYADSRALTNEHATAHSHIYADAHTHADSPTSSDFNAAARLEEARVCPG